MSYTSVSGRGQIKDSHSTCQSLESCLSRGSGCNGLSPCQTCIRRKLTCSYTTNNSSDNGLADTAGSPPKRRHIETSPQSIPAVLKAASTSPMMRMSQNDGNHLWDEVPIGQSRKGGSTISTSTVPHPPSSSGYDHTRKDSMSDRDTHAGHHHGNGPTEETSIYTTTRMLQDQTGRLLYFGDSSTLSVLQLIRIIVENTAGTDKGQPFINDPKRHRILEHIIDFPDNMKVPSILPDKQTTDVLLESYFINTCGIIEVFDRKTFVDEVEASYRDPLSASNHSLCLLFLVLALGLILATPTPGSRQEAIIKKLLAGKPDRAELFFRSARSMCDDDSGFEDADFWSIQALSLMTMYMMVVSKRNRAYAYLGMAVRSAYALGLHREETMNDVIFTQLDMTIRRNLWKTLFILDRFLAASLGRPVAIYDEDCSCKITDDDVSSPLSGGEATLGAAHARSLDACVRSCHLIGETLKVFSARKISTPIVQGILDMANEGGQGPHTTLQRRRSRDVSIHPAAGIAGLHMDLLSLHSLILLTRQFFIMHAWKLEEFRSGLSKHPPMYNSPMARYSEACVIASYHTIHLVKKSEECGHLPRRNPFVIYFLFAASLVVFMNQFASLYRTDAYTQTVTDAIAMMKFCAQTDTQARRVLEIMDKFSKVVANWTKEHTYDAPELSSDLNGLYSQVGSPHPEQHEHEHDQPLASPSSVAEPPHTPRLVNLPHQQHHHQQQHQTSLPGPGPLPSLSEILIQHPPGAPLGDMRMNGIHTHNNPQHHHMGGQGQPSLHHHHPSIDASATSRPPGASSHTMVDDPMNEDIEFDFDGLWSNWINHVVPVSGVAAGAGGLISPLGPQFPPPAASNGGGGGGGGPSSSETYAGFAMPADSRILPAAGISGSIPLYHSTNFG
ncbi:activator of stress genes 1 [Podospora conica]|nr:activator of stress genes 1 [Schizothecium conicum]